MAAIDQIDFKQTKQKFFDKPLYCRAMRKVLGQKKMKRKKKLEKLEKKMNMRVKKIPTRKLKIKITSPDPDKKNSRFGNHR